MDLARIKSEMVTAWRVVLQARIATANQGLSAARSGTRVDGAHRPSNRGERGAVTAQGYLALGLGQRLVALKADLANLDEMGEAPRQAVAVGALIRLQIDEGAPQFVAILPGGDATVVPVAGFVGASHQIRVLSMRSPLIAAIAGFEPGESGDTRDGERTITVLDIV